APTLTVPAAARSLGSGYPFRGVRRADRLRGPVPPVGRFAAAVGAPMLRRATAPALVVAPLARAAGREAAKLAAPEPGKRQRHETRRQNRDAALDAGDLVQVLGRQGVGEDRGVAGAAPQVGAAD